MLIDILRGFLDALAYAIATVFIGWLVVPAEWRA